MATYGMAGNELMTCPYDETHRVKRSRFQLHVSKCEMNHLSQRKDTCPFNAQHRCDPGMLSYHLMNCPDRAPLDKKLVASAEKSTFKGHTGVPSYHSPAVVSHENWDTELAPQPAPGYQPSVEPPSGGIRLNFDQMQPAERKKYYKNLFSENSDDEAELENGLERHEENLHELRKPTTVSLAQMLDPGKQINLANIGLGRGQATGSSSSRIAANIFGDQAKPVRQPRSSPNIPGFKKTSNFAVGRGAALNGANERFGPGTMLHEVENIVGLGRGAKS